MLRQVFDALKDDSRKGDFVELTNRDKEDLDIILTNDEIEVISKTQWKKVKTLDAALKCLNKKNGQRENKTKK